MRKTEQQPDGSEQVYDYHYDDRYRLVEVLQNGIVVESYAYDANGNRTSHSSLLRGVVNQSASYVSGDQLAHSGNAVYSYDANGRLSQKVVTDNGDAAVTDYQYSSTGRLLAVTTADKAISYRHNALGQRVAKLVNGVVTEKYLWQDLTTLLAVYHADGTVKQRFEYGLGHTPVSFTQGGQRYYIQSDHLGSPRVISTANGTVIKTISYDSYGNVIEDSNPDFSIPFGFAGGLQDCDTGLIRFGYRDYDPQTGRWTARDPIGFAGGDTNLYGYVLGDPVNFYDPDGLSRLRQAPGSTQQGRQGTQGYNYHQAQMAYLRMQQQKLGRSDLSQLREALNNLPDKGYDVMQNELKGATCIGPSCSITVQDCQCGTGWSFPGAGDLFGKDVSVNIQQCGRDSYPTDISLRPMPQDDPNCTCTTRTIRF